MQNTTGTGDFNEYDTMDNSAELFIQLSQNNSDKRTRIFFLPQGTDGLDVGYDAAGLDLGAYSIYTRLISDDVGVNMDIQTLNFDNMLGEIIPLGVNIQAGSDAELPYHPAQLRSRGCVHPSCLAVSTLVVWLAAVCIPSVLIW